MADEKKTFQPGDVCWLRSGGPSLTVIKATVSDTSPVWVRVSWFGGCEPQTAEFPAEALTHTKPPFIWP